jgi:hypothetical protein
VEPSLPELLREVRRIAYAPSQAPDDALRRIWDLLRRARSVRRGGGFDDK